jgi:recombination protein RecT
VSSRDVAVRQPPTPAQRFKQEVVSRQDDFAAALPPQVDPKKFVRVVQTAAIANPELLAADRASLFESALRAAQDGLLPDGREAAFVIFNVNVAKRGEPDRWISKVQYLRMVGGLLKLIRNSGELASIAAHVVYEKDDFAYVLGDEERIEHKPYLQGERGRPIFVYAIAKTKDGAIYREIMTRAEVETVRAVSRAKDAKSGPWVRWWDQMAKKSVIRRLAKRLPMSTDLDQAIRRDDDVRDFRGPRLDAAPAGPTLEERLNGSGAMSGATGFSPEFVASELDAEPADDGEGEGDDDARGRGDTIDAEWEPGR